MTHAFQTNSVMVSIEKNEGLPHPGGSVNTLVHLHHFDRSVSPSEVHGRLKIIAGEHVMRTVL